ncbi:hypothetical protein CSE899_08556 [Cronobacter sakazakii E899]|nr:hypothetical protein CSE899_08556 [Cronobacter sakazakii E899]
MNSASLAPALDALPAALLVYDKDERLIAWNAQVSRFTPVSKRIWLRGRR